MDIPEQDTITDSKWNESLCLKLIEYYRLLNVLWDYKDPHYFDKQKKDEAWIRIGKALQKSPQECKHKISVLYSSFRREKAKIMQSIQGETATYASNWFGFKAMSFLLIKEKRPLEPLSKKKRKSPASDRLEMYVKEAIAAEKEKIKEIADYGNKKRSGDPCTSTSTQSCSGADTSEKDDETTSFTNFVASKMKKYSDRTKIAVQQAICDVMFKADQGYYERSSQTVTSSMMTPRVVIRPEDTVQALVMKEEDIDSE